MVKRKKRAKKRKTTLTYYFKIAAFIMIALSYILFVVFIFRLYRESTPVIESSRNEMKRVPFEVRKKFPLSEKKTIQVPILMYHYVEYVQDRHDTFRQSLNINPDVFEEQMKTLKDAGYTFMMAKDLSDVLDGNKILPKKPILITIDDGHWDVDTTILPILEKYQVKATAYVIPGLTGGSDFMTQQQIRDILNSGLIEIGAHTVNHIALKGVLLQTVQYEVEESKKMLEDTYHIHVYSFAYPSGSFDLQAIDVVKKAGFRTAVSTIPGKKVSQSNKYFLYRIRPGYRTGQDLIDLIEKM